MATPSLLTLPAETLMAICQNLCTHCVRKGSEPPAYNQGPSALKDANEGLAALSYLSRTCKTLCDIAQPILYHMPWAIKRDSAAIARMIVQRPDLAQQVQELVFGPDLWAVGYWTVNSDEDRRLFEAEMATETIYNSRGDRVSPICLWDADNLPWRMDGGDMCEYLAQEFLAMLIMTKTPNVKQLTLEGGYLNQKPFFRPHMLPSLTTIRVLNWEARGVQLDGMTGILVAAPALETLHCRLLNSSALVGRGQSHFRHENVTTVVFEWSTLSDLETTMRSFPNLKTFRYQSGGATVNEMGEATPVDISTALLVRRDTLQTVSIDLQEAFYGDDLDEDQVMRGLSDMKALVNLELCGTCVYVETDDDTTTDGTLLTSLLPSSLQVFGLHKPHEHIYQDILGLASGAAELFPKLIKVMIRGIEGEQAEVFRQAFESSGIKFIQNETLPEFHRWR
ncbi:unnamed protein product [Clonostachys rhizophaga]|uniref:F-box domain-containing protein n=1 Tax=Clonostachys rhizophaga TaxID=160324 RepID=A0A9N9VBY6_9HYPO|nr:unnamed protein product [Clonostachys rhizophaga]